MDEMSDLEKQLHTKLVNAETTLEQANIRHLGDSLDAIKYRAMYTSGKMAGKAFILVLLAMGMFHFMIKNDVLQQLGFVTDNIETVGYPDTILEVVMGMTIGILFIAMIQHWSIIERKRRITR